MPCRNTSPLVLMLVPGEEDVEIELIRRQRHLIDPHQVVTATARPRRSLVNWKPTDRFRSPMKATVPIVAFGVIAVHGGVAVVGQILALFSGVAEHARLAGEIPEEAVAAMPIAAADLESVKIVQRAQRCKSWCRRR